MGRLSQVSKRMIKTALNVSSHHSHTGQRVLRKTVMEKGSGSGWKNNKRLFGKSVVAGHAYLRAALGPLFSI